MKKHYINCRMTGANIIMIPAVWPAQDLTVGKPSSDGHLYRRDHEADRW
jgi:hypothetical protein